MLTISTSGCDHNSILTCMLANAFSFDYRLTYSDLCLQIPEPKFRQCLLNTLAILFKLMCSYHEIMAFQLDDKVNFGSCLSVFLSYINCCHSM